MCRMLRQVVRTAGHLDALSGVGWASGFSLCIQESVGPHLPSDVQLPLKQLAWWSACLGLK